MSKVENAVVWAVGIANDNSHGYDQINRSLGNANGTDYDCSSLVCTAFEQAGIPVISKGGATYTGNMLSGFKKVGFKTVPISQRRRGDVLLNTKHHTALVVDYNTICHASINENGKTTGGKKGDQTGREICTRSYYSYPWDYCLRYEEGTTPTPAPSTGGTVTVNTRLLKKGSKGADVKSLQALLNAKNNSKLVVDGDFGSATYQAVIAYQKSHSLSADGEVGANTWNSLINK